MTQPVANPAASDPNGPAAVAGPTPVAEAPRRSEPPVTQTEPDIRLVIEEDGASGSFVYKTVDRKTGEVLNQFPREDLLKLREDLEYLPGMVVNARG